MIEVQLSRIVINENREDQLIVLKEIEGERKISITIGFMEASSIKMHVSEIEPTRPLTHDLVASLLTYLDADVDRLVIDDMVQGTYFAKLCLINNDDEEIVIDCRPSDGIAIALRMEAPIFIEESLLDQSDSESA